MASARHLTLAAALAASCGGLTLEPQDPRPDATAPEAGVDAAPDGAASADASPDAPSDAAALDAPLSPYGPSSCADVGRYPGRAACCDGKYCGGECNLFDRPCGCGGGPGCAWPAICCKQFCMAPAYCVGEW